jgi:succinate dehydrogenase/fumarate reductase-like Fe-S protein
MTEARKAALRLQISVTERAIARFAPKKGVDQDWAGFTVDADARARLSALLTQLKSELKRH